MNLQFTFCFCLSVEIATKQQTYNSYLPD